MDRKKDAILKATAALTENYKNEELFMPKNGRSLPSRAVIIDVVKELFSGNDLKPHFRKNPFLL